MLMRIKKLLERNAIYIAVILTIFVTFISLVSLKGVVKVKVENSDKIGHFLAYFTLGVVWLYALKNKHKKVLIIFFLILYGIIIEILQGVLTSNRQADFYDFIANTTGVLLAYVLTTKLSFLQ